MVECCAQLCFSASYRKTPEITFHKFPKDENLKDIWIKNINRKDWQPNSSSVLCSKHFEARFIERSVFRTVLAPGAIPTIFKKLPSTSEEVHSDASEGSASCTKPNKKCYKKRKLVDDSQGYNSNVEDEYAWVKKCALELRQMEPDQQIFAKRAITFILMEGRLGRLHRNSVQINNNVPDYETQNSEDSPSDELLVVRRKKTRSSTYREFTAPSGSLLLPGTSSRIGSRKSAKCPSRVKSKQSTIASNSVAFQKSTALSTSSSLDNSKSSFIIVSHTTPVSVSSSLRSTKPFDSPVAMCQKKTAPDNLSSTVVKLQPFGETWSSSDEMDALLHSDVCTSSGDPLLVKIEPSDNIRPISKSVPYESAVVKIESCDDETGFISSSASHNSAGSAERSLALVKAEPSSPPTSPDFNVVIKHEPE